MNSIGLVLALLVGVLGLGLGLVLGRARGAQATGERDAARLELEALRRDRDELAGRERAAADEVAGLRASLAHVQQAADQRSGDLERSLAMLKDSFATLSCDALDGNTKRFLDMAGATMREAGVRATGELEQRKQAVEHLVAPLRETLAKVEGQLREIESARSTAYATLTEQVRSANEGTDQLRKQTASLVHALSKPQARGRWGELQLRRVVEVAGMSAHCDFEEQVSVSTAGGVQRPDMIIRLAGGKNVIVDSKVSLAAYLEAAETDDDTVREERLAAHARHLRKHVDELAAKAYWTQFTPTPEFVILFVPGEAFLAPALERAPQLLEEAASKGVILATPSTLIATLRTIAYAWQQERLADNAQAVIDVGKELYSRLATMGLHVNGLGKALTSAVQRYNETVGSLEGRVLVTARKLVDLHIVEANIEAPTQVESTPRSVQASELVASANDSLIALPDADHWLASPA